MVPLRILIKNISGICGIKKSHFVSVTYSDSAKHDPDIKMMNSLYIKGTRIRCGNSNLLKSSDVSAAVCVYRYNSPSIHLRHGAGVSTFSINCLPTAVLSILPHSFIIIHSLLVSMDTKAHIYIYVYFLLLLYSLNININFPLSLSIMYNIYIYTRV